MSNIKFSGLPAAASVVDTDIFAASQGGVSKQQTGSRVKAYAQTGIAGGKTIDGGTLTTETLELRNNATDDLGVDINGDGSLTVNTPNYETLVTSDDDIPNKKYVDDSHPDTVTEVLTISGDGQTAFTLGEIPATVSESILVLNGQIRLYTTDFTISGTSLTWNDPGSLTLLTTDTLQIWYNVNLGAPSAPVAVYTKVEANGNQGNHRTRTIGGSGNFNFEFAVPDDFNALVSLELIISARSGAGGSGKDVDLSSSYGTLAEVINVHSETDTSSTYDFGTSGEFAAVSIASVFSALGAGDVCGFNWDNNSVGGTIDTFFIKLVYTR